MNYKKLLNVELYKNAFNLFLNSSFSSVLGFIFWIMVTHSYSVYDVGIASVLISSTTLLSNFANLGFNISIIRFIPPSDNKKDLINSCFTLSLIFAVIFAVIFILGKNIWASSLNSILCNIYLDIIFVFFVAILTLSSLQNTFFVSKRATIYCLLKDSLTGILKIAILPFLVFLGALGIFFSWNLAVLVTFLIGMILVYRLQKDYHLRLKISRNIMSEMFHFSMGNYFSGLFNILPGLILPLMISNILSPDMSAYFYISWTLAGVLFMVAGATYSSLLVESSYDNKEFKGNAVKSAKFITLLILPAIIIILLFGGNILSIFGENYSKYALNMLILLSVSSIPYSINYIYMAKLNVEHRIKELLLINLTISIVTLLVAYLFMDKIGIVAAGVGWLSIQSLISVWSLFKFRSEN
jgi:O-antigen/teichoic acid export membrane protein